MDDKVQIEIEHLQNRRKAIKRDLNTFGDQLSAVSQVVLLMHIAIIDNDIRDLKKSQEDMGFEDFMRKAWGNDQ